MPGGFPDLSNAIRAFEEEQRKLTDFQQKLKETSTSVDSAKRLMTLTMDGHGQISDVKFNTTAYRSMAPAELASIVLETFQKARTQSMERMQELMGENILPGVNVNEVANGMADMTDLLGKLTKPSMDLLQETEAGLPDRSKDAPKRDDDEWELS